jgi:hypothetical protein
MEEFHGGLHLNSLLQYPAVPLIDVQHYLNSIEWTKQFISKILQLTHLQWIYKNIILHDRHQGYLCNKQLEDLLQEITELSDLSLDEGPNNCRFLLEINFTELASSHLELQRYWTLTMKAALTAQHHKRKRSAQLKRVCC